MCGLFCIEDVYQVTQGFFQPILEVVSRDCPVMREELHCVGNPTALSCWDVTLIIPIVMECRSYIESFGCVFGPGFSLTSSVMDSDLASWWCHRGGIIVKVSMDHSIG